MTVKVLNFIHFKSFAEIHASQHDKVVACYVEGWAAYRPERGQFTIEDIRPEYCTHLIYAFAGLDATAWKIKSLDPKLDLDNSGMMINLSSR